MILFICGIPASGKSGFGEYLRDAHGYFYIDMEYSPWPDEDIHTIWNKIFECPCDENRVRAFVIACEKKNSRVALDLGFPPSKNYSCIVPLLKKLGCRIIWFQCDEDVARRRYEARGNRSINEFEDQMGRIKDNWSRIIEEIGPEVIEVSKPDRSSKTHEELYSEIFG
jgi:hypothetical protein